MIQNLFLTLCFLILVASVGCTPPKNLAEESLNWTPLSVTPAEEGEVLIQSPQLNALVSSPLVIEGEAKRRWFWEGEIDLELVDANGKVVKRWFGKALRDGWMEAETTPFRAEVEFSLPSTSVGEIVLFRQTEVGDRTEYRLPIRFHE
jgi:hypothetical protein